MMALAPNPRAFDRIDRRQHRRQDHRPAARPGPPPAAFDLFGRMFLSGINLHGINEDAEAVFSQAGLTADCRYVAYQGPFAGGTNVCDVDGEDSGAAFGADLIAQPGGIDIYKTEVANFSRYAAERAAEQLVIQAQNQQPTPAPPPVLYHQPAAPYQPPPAAATPAPPPRPVPTPGPYEAPPPPGWWTYSGAQAANYINPLTGQRWPSAPQTQNPLYSFNNTTTAANVTATGGQSSGAEARSAAPVDPLESIAEAAAGGGAMAPALSHPGEAPAFIESIQQFAEEIPTWAWMAAAAAGAGALFFSQRR